MKKQCVLFWPIQEPAIVSGTTKQLSMDKKKEFEKYKAEDEDSGLTKAQAKERANIKGVWFEEDYLREVTCLMKQHAIQLVLHWTEMWQISG